MALWMGCGGQGADDSGALAEGDLVTYLGAPGDHAVGFHVEDISYTQPDGMGDRELRLAWWFPAEAEGVVPARYLFESIEADGVWTDVTPAAGQFPVVVFSHGHQGYAENSAFLMAHLASHGWIAAAPDHTHNTTLDGSERDTEIYLQRPWDISAVIDHLEALPASHLLTGLPDTSTIMASGHSFGGYTMMALAGGAYDMDTWSAACADGDTAAFCSTMTPELETLLRSGFHEPRIGGYVPMAGGDFDKFGESGLGVISQPILQLDGGFDSPDERNRVWDAASSAGDVRVTLDTAGHQSFTDFAGMIGDEDIEGLIDIEEGWRVISVYVSAYGRRLLGESDVDGILDGSEHVGEDITLVLGE